MQSTKRKLTEKNFIKSAMNKASDFIKDKAKNIKKSASKILRDIRKNAKTSKTRTNFEPGKLLNFQYNAKFKQNRYDAVPLVISLGAPKNPKLQRTHILGLNIHHLPLKDRVKIASFFVELNELRGGKLQYSDIKPFMHKFKGHPVLRMYIISRISDKVYEIENEMYLTAAAIPSEKMIG